MSKSSQAFRTIREVADWLDVAAHVLRFWESKFPQIKPVKRAGGRRYYRPADMELVGGIKVLLHDRGLTIRGVQKMIREEGVAAVAALSPPIDVDMGDVIDGDLSPEIEAWTEDGLSDAVDIAERPVYQTRFAFEAEAELEGEPAETPDVEDDGEIPGSAPGSEPERPAEASPEEAPAAPVAGEDMGQPPAAPAASAVEPAFAIDRLAARLRDPAALSRAQRAALRPALGALRDRMRADPAA